MADMKKKLKKLLDINDVVYSASNGAPMKINEFDDDGFYTDEDYFSFDEIRELFFLTKRGYEEHFREATKA